MTRNFRRALTRFALVLCFFFLLFLLVVHNNKGLESPLKIRRPDRGAAAVAGFEKLQREASLENKERRARVQRVCQKYRLGPYRTPDFEQEFREPPAPQYSVFYIDRAHNISYCPIYKAGSTTWIYNMCLLNGAEEAELASGKEQISMIARRLMPEIDLPLAESLLNSSAKLLIVRHPFERLLSAYRDKLENSVAGREHGTLHFYKKFGSKIVAKFRDENVSPPREDQFVRVPGKPEPAGVEPTFREFVEYLVNTDLANYGDDHWMPYYLFCTPCLVDYDFIAKVETLARDQAYVIHRLGLDEAIKPRWQHAVGSSSNASSSSSPSINRVSDLAKIYFGQLTQRQLRKLHDKFRLDLELFGYSAEEYYDYATAA
ncbi:carbohydrate sulfotransferase 11-like [Trichogramma pretiosum]|uniref:carbohydrate sulfotransferase 11-like n=1 Tax=Trichogramma pretiosum TaxID=7493 RepID=UPI0006C9727E|nr:carbohydrate sulfotransferase 11-like [Trichogramma pretiosum]